MNGAVGMFFGWLVRASWQGAVLVGIVFLFQWIFRKRLNARWRYVLWLLVLVRLLLPMSPHSSLSVFNYAGLDSPGGQPKPKVAAAPTIISPIRQVSERALANEAFSEEAGKMPALTGWKPALPEAGAKTQALGNLQPAVNAGIWFHRENLANLGRIIWALGVGLLGLRVIVQNFDFANCLRARAVTDAETIDLFQECKSLLEIRFRVGLVETGQVKSPALHGFLRPCLLLPEHMIGGFSPEELRYIFLNELAHVKRRDMAVHWLETALKILHWFNPILWLAFRHVAADRELACDELALSHVGEQASKHYGEAIVKVLETCAPSPGLPWVMGILEDKNQMVRRISMILKFKQSSGWTAWAALLLVALGLVTLTDARSKATEKPTPKPVVAAPAGTGEPELIAAIAENAIRPDLLGNVQRMDGMPVAATVFIFTARPKVGSSTFCPSCYLDCRKSAKSDAKGDFKIESLDPQLLFRILIVAKNYEPKFVEKVNPANGPTRVVLKVSDAAQAGPERTLAGRVLNPKGDPIVGAVVNSHGIFRKNGSGMWGTLPGVDPLSVTDEKGEFRITAREAFESMDVRVEARAFANKTFTKLTSGTQAHDLVMTEGATLMGRVMFEGKPLKNVSVGMVSVDRGMEGFTGNFDVGTGEDGRFAFVNLPADVDYFVYGLMKSMQPYGAIPIKKIHSAKDDQATDIGDLVVEPAYRLAGRVVLTDGITVPPNTRLLIGREEAWDSLQLNLAEDGSFDSTGIPSGRLSLSVRVPGYRVSAKSASLDRLNPYGLVGRMERDITNLVLLMEKGAKLEPDYNLSGPESDRPRNRPLHGAEVAPDHSHQWLISGRVIDRDSKEPIPNFHLIPGNADLSWGTTHWDAQHRVDAINGTYQVYLDSRWSQPMLQVQAEGYLPVSIPLIPLQHTDANTVLKRGTGPTGVVLLPDGKPAAGVSVLLICADDEQKGRLNNDSELSPYRNKERLTKTDDDGRFSFAPELGMQLLAAASPAGFKKIPVQNFKTNSTIMLEPYGQVRGKLKRASGPGKGEDLDLAFADDAPMSRIQLPHHIITDDQGRFEFDHVPPGILEISYREYIPGQPRRSWHNELLKQITLKPGQSFEAIITASDRPAAQDILDVRHIHIPGALPEPARIAGVQVKGQVFLPNGNPAADTQVGLQINGKPLVLGKAAFGGNAHEEGLVVKTDANGDFTLPIFERAQSVIALNDEGFGEMSLAEFRVSPKIKLQAWGRIEGTLHIGQRVATNEIVTLTKTPFEIDALTYDSREFESKTDEQGRFVITYVPPGERKLARRLPMRNGSWSWQPLGEVVVKAGEATKVELGGNGHTIIGKLKSAQAMTNVNWSHMDGNFHTRWPDILQQPASGKTREEQMAFQHTAEYKSKVKESLKDFHQYFFGFSSDASFVADEVLPGNYELDIYERFNLMDPRNFRPQTNYLHAEISVPETINKNAPIDLGTIEVKLKAFKTP